VATSGRNLQGKVILLACLINGLGTLDGFLRLYILCFITVISDVSRIIRSSRPAATVFLGLPFDSEDGGDMFLRKIGFLPSTRRDNLRAHNVHNHYREPQTQQHILLSLSYFDFCINSVFLYFVKINVKHNRRTTTSLSYAFNIIKEYCCYPQGKEPR
jgi:hypothetical protein